MKDKDALFYLYRADPNGSKRCIINAAPLPALTLTSYTRPCVTDYTLIQTVYASLDSQPADIVLQLKAFLSKEGRALNRSDVLVREVDGQLTIYWIENPNPPDLLPLPDFFKIPPEHDSAYRQGYEQAVKDLNTPRPVIIPGAYEHTVCPQCGKDFSDIEDNFDGMPDRAVGLSRCPHCGQMLTWEEFSAQVNPHKK